MGRLKSVLHDNPIQSVICVGYSHGAALALLATEAIVRDLGDTVSVEGYGFGIPRVVKGKLPNVICQRLSCFCSIRNIADLVTHLPPTAMGYHHVNLLCIGEKGKYSPIKAHTPLAYIHELKQYQKVWGNRVDTRSAVERIKSCSRSGERWVFRSVHPMTPRR